MSVPALPARSRLRGMEGLRGVAAVSIVVYHSWLHGLRGRGVGIGPVDDGLRHLSAAVLLFFTLSGLLLYRPFAAAIVRADPLPDRGRYLRNRFLRIFPAYVVVLLTVGLVLRVAIVPDGPSVLTIGSMLDHPAALLSDLLLVQSYQPATFLTGVGPAWTLSIEVAFYLALPLVAAVAHQFAARRARRVRLVLALAPALAFLLLGLIGKAVGQVAFDGTAGWDRSWQTVVARSFLANADLFAFGMAVAVLVVAQADGAVRLPRRWRPVTLAAAAITAALALSVPEGVLGNPRYDLFAAATSALVVAALVLAPADPSNAIIRGLEHPSMVAAGLVSYSLYLWHEPLIFWLERRGLLTGSGVSGLLTVVALVGVAAGSLAALSYRWVERPALRRRARP